MDGGVDVASYAAADTAVSVDLSVTAAQNTGGGGVDILSGMEGLIGSDYGDSLIGSSENNLIYGGGGNDTVQVGSGYDTVFGGSGTNTLSFAGYLGEVRIDLSLTTAQNYGYTYWYDYITITGFNNVIGNDGRNYLTGNGAANLLQGGDNNDDLVGGGGNDTLDAGVGFNEVDGGDGIDTVTVASLAYGVTIDLGLPLDDYWASVQTLYFNSLLDYTLLRSKRCADPTFCVTM